MIVTLFEESLHMKLSTPIDLLYLGGSIALIGLALYLTHAAESGGKAHDDDHAEDEAKH